MKALNRFLLHTAVILALILFAGPAFGAFSQEQASAAEKLAGTWQGTLKVPGLELQIYFKITTDPGGNLSATMDVPIQSAKNVPIERVTFEKGILRLELSSIKGVFEGKVNDDFSEIQGSWTQSGLTFPLVLKPIEAVIPLVRPQDPKPPYTYDEEEVTFENSKAKIKLAGTLTTPRGNGPFVGVLLISGSGPQDRNEEVFGHRPFLVLADYLTRQGIAVLRVDDRGVGKSSGHFEKATSLDFAQDVHAGIAFLKGRKKIAAGKIGLAGHSEGALIAPMVAAESPDVAFIVLLAGTGIPGDRILLLQGELIARANGEKEEDIKSSLKDQKKMYEILKRENDPHKAEQEIRKVFEQVLARMSDEEKRRKGITKELLETQVQALLSPWFRFFINYDPAPTLKRVRCPVLALIGEKDLQVPARVNLEAIKKALSQAGNKNFKVMELPGLNHLFQAAQTGSPSEYANIEETMSPKMLKITADWILAQTKKGGEF